MNRVAWRPHLRAAVLSPEDVVVLSETGHTFLRGRAYAQAARCIDEGLTHDDIHVRLEHEGIPPVAARLTLSHLEALNLIADVDSDPAEAPFWYDAGSAGARAPHSGRVAVQALGGFNAALLRAALADAGLTLAEREQSADLLIVAAQNYLAPELQEIDRVCRRQRRPWMLIKPVGVVPWLGPLFVPESTGCWHCLAQRLRLNRQTESVLEAQSGQAVSPPQPAASWSIDMALRLAGVEIVRWLTLHSSVLQGQILTLDLRTNGLTRHSLTRRPQCPACGVALPEFRRAAVSFPIDSCLKSGPEGRARPTAEAWKALQHHVSPITGVVRSLSETSLDGFLHVAAAHSLPLHRYDLHILRDNLLGRSGGKGATPLQARMSALCEALERYSGIWQGGEASRDATCAELGDAAVDPATFLGFSERQYAQRDTLNAGNDDPHTWVPVPLDKQRTIAWTPLWSLTHEAPRYLPAASCYFGHPEMKDFFCGSDSCGCAAGGTLTEAAAQALLELLERDAAAIWWYNELPRPALDLDDFAEPLLSLLRPRYGERGREIWALDLTADFGVPVVAAISARVNHGVEDIIFGLAADFDPGAALRRALLEMHQSLFLVADRDAAGNTRYRTDRPATQRWLRSATRDNQPHLAAGASLKPVRRGDYQWPQHNDRADDLGRCVNLLRAAGLEVLALDQTRPDIGLPVARVVVPGLCHIWPRLGTRRLFEVPVRLGWLASAKSEAELNRWPIYF